MINDKSRAIFETMPIWKSILKFSIPAIIMLFVYGIYSFSDSLLSINLAHEKYQNLITEEMHYNTKDLVRLFMSASMPISTVMFGIITLFGQGVGKRYAINLGAKDEKRAKSVIQTAFTSMIIVSIILIPLFLLISKVWIKSIYQKSDAQFADIIADESFKYFWIIIISFPIQIYNQILISLLRGETKNKSILFASMLPIFLNLFLDYVFMGLLDMNISGGAWASFISWFVTGMILSFFIWKSDSKVAKFKNFLGLKYFSFVTLISIILVGVSPLLRSLTQAIASSITTKTNQDVSKVVYGETSTMIILITSIMPILMLIFPIIFGFVQGSSAIIGYNYGSKNFKRLKQAVIYNVVFTFIAGIIMYLISSFILIEPLLNFQGMKDKVTNFNNKEIKIELIAKSKIIVKIILLALIFIAPTIGALSFYGSTDRLGLSILVSLFRSFILFLPIYFLMAYISKNNSGDVYINLTSAGNIFAKQYIVWWYYPVASFVTSFISWIMMYFSFKRIEEKHSHLETKINFYIEKLFKKTKKIK